MDIRIKSDKYKVIGRLLFIREFLKHPLQIGSVIPSSRFLERRIVAAADPLSAKVIVELGPGTGGVTHALLSSMSQHAKLLSIEINPFFYSLLSTIKDDRLIVHLGNARELAEYIALYDLGLPDAIISGIPFSTMNRSDGSNILEVISSLLAPNGRFVAYQVRSQVATLCTPYLGAGQITTEYLNIPPMRIFQWVKNG